MDTRQKSKSAPAKRMTARQLQACLTAALFLTLIIFSIFSGVTRHKQQMDYAESRDQVSSVVEQNIRLFIRTFDSISLAGANVEGDLLPKLRQYYYCMCQLDDALTYAFGPRYTLLNDAVRNKINSALSAYDEAFRTGKSTSGAYESLSEAVGMLDNILATRFTPSGSIKPTK